MGTEGQLLKIGQKPRYPRPQSLVLAHKAICAYIPTEEVPVCEWRKSFAGTPNLRIAATTNGMPWIVDVYSGHFFRVNIGTGVGSVCKTLPSLVGYMRRTLDLGPIEVLNEPKD